MLGVLGVGRKDYKMCREVTCPSLYIYLVVSISIHLITRG